MEKKGIIVKITNDGIWLNSSLLLPIYRTNIPFTHLKFRFHEPIYWKLEMIKYESKTNSLNVRVSDYSLSDIKGFGEQIPKKSVEILLFENFDWKKLEPLLYSYQKVKLLEVLTNIESDPFSSGDSVFPVPQSTDWERNRQLLETGQERTKFQGNQYDSVYRKPKVYDLTEEFKIKYTDAQFKLGYVTFRKKVKQLGAEVEFKIVNEHILAEFENIKFWFAKKLKSNKFTVKVRIEVTDNKITEVVASSKEIELINPELIEGVKYQRTMSLKKMNITSTVDKSLFTSEEIFKAIDSEDIEGNVFKQSEQDILDFFMQNENIRNRKQLAYLSGKKQSEKNKLRYTLNPNFGFLFFIEGVENNHYVWELLHSHATYIWSIPKESIEIELQFKRIESIVNQIRYSGRDEYKRAYKNNHKDNDLVFRVIYHKEIDSHFVDSFPKWKDELNEQLT